MLLAGWLGDGLVHHLVGGAADAALLVEGGAFGLILTGGAALGLGLAGKGFRVGFRPGGGLKVEK